jgi:DNA invertase Pin-like site-specific DNA recombinase
MIGDSYEHLPFASPSSPVSLSFLASRRSVPAPTEDRGAAMKTAALYLRVSTLDQHPETQLHDLRAMNRLNIEYVSFRENLDTGGPLGRAVVIIIGAIAELERNLIVERVRAGMRRARLEGRHIGRRPIDVDRIAVLRERDRGQSLSQIATTHRVSRATVSRIIKLAQPPISSSTSI